MAATTLVAFAASFAQASTQSPTEVPTEVPIEVSTTPALEEPEQAPRTGRPGFVLDRGRYTAFDVPGARVGTSPIGINNRGVTVGKYNDGTEVVGSGASEHGFIRGRRGRFTTIDMPGARSTAVSRINDRGQMVGVYSKTTGRVGDDPNRRAFLRQRGRFTTIHVPDAVYTQAFGINDDSHVVGEFVDASGNGHGFLWKNGRFTTIDVPGSVYTAALDVNDRGKIVGIHVRDFAEPLEVHGFVLDRGRYTSFDAPGVAITYPFGINNKGQIVGDTSNDGAVTNQGFLLRKGINGPYTPINVPNSPRTSLTDINDDGTIIGIYENTDAEWEPELGDPQPSTMMSDSWESMASARDLSEQRAAEQADKKDKADKAKKDKAGKAKKRRNAKQAGERNRPEQTGDGDPAKEPKQTGERDRAKKRTEPAQRGRPEQSSTKDRPDAERPQRDAERRRSQTPDQLVYRIAPASDTQPAANHEAVEDTSTITAEPSDDPSEPTGFIQIRAADSRPLEDLDRTAAISHTNRMTARGLTVAVPVAAAWLLMMTRRRGRGGRELARSTARETLHSTGFWHGRRTPGGRRTVTCRESDASPAERTR